MALWEASDLHCFYLTTPACSLPNLPRCLRALLNRYRTSVRRLGGFEIGLV